ncbi:hypothetical protein HYX19_02275 [Candidatus Woesearchaeota archaeon]|nr:hypothetical protein [Candidatus Woesearchaeota archaeon]
MKSKKEKGIEKEELKEERAYQCWSCGFIIQQAIKPDNCPECKSNKLKEKPVEFEEEE